MLEIKVFEESLLDIKADVIVNPANSLGVMGGGVAAVIKQAGGKEIEEEAVGASPIAVGSAVLTTAGRLPFKGVIHAPTMELPVMLATSEKVAKATVAALKLADWCGFSSIAFPGMGTGVGSLDFNVAASTMITEISSFRSKSLKRVFLVDINKLMIEAWQMLL